MAAPWRINLVNILIFSFFFKYKLFGFIISFHTISVFYEYCCIVRDWFLLFNFLDYPFSYGIFIRYSKDLFNLYFEFINVNKEFIWIFFVFKIFFNLRLNLIFHTSFKKFCNQESLLVVWNIIEFDPVIDLNNLFYKSVLIFWIFIRFY